jgi:hypothetical protein
MSRMRGSHELANYSDTQGHRREISPRKTDPRARSCQNASPLLQLPTEVLALSQCLDGLVSNDINTDNSVYCISSPE